MMMDLVDFFPLELEIVFQVFYHIIQNTLPRILAEVIYYFFLRLFGAQTPDPYPRPTHVQSP